MPSTKDGNRTKPKEAKIINYTYNSRDKSWTGSEGVQVLGIDPDTENGYISVEGIDFSVLPAIIAETDKIAKEKTPPPSTTTGTASPISSPTTGLRKNPFSSGQYAMRKTMFSTKPLLSCFSQPRANGKAFPRKINGFSDGLTA